MRPRGPQLYDDGMCIAYRTTPVDGEPAELWLLKESLRDEPDFVAMFADGCTFLARFALASLARVAELEEGSAVLVAQPWVALASLLRAGGVPPGLAVTVLRDLARDLARLPSDVALRSLSPRSLAIAVTGRPRILNPALARFADRLTTSQPGIIKGPLRYISPEVASGERAGAASDVFSAGLVLHELLCGRHPVEDARNDIDALMRLRAAELPTLASRRPDLPVALTSAIDRMLAREPGDRPAPGELADWLEARLPAYLWPGDRVLVEIKALAPEAVEAAIVYGF